MSGFSSIGKLCCRYDKRSFEFFSATMETIVLIDFLDDFIYIDVDGMVQIHSIYSGMQLMASLVADMLSETYRAEQMLKRVFPILFDKGKDSSE